MNESPGPDEWVGDDGSVEKLECYVAVAGAMRLAARKGIRRVIRRAPSEHDVEEVVLQAFNALWKMDLTALESPTAMGCRIAYRRGQDRGDRVLREQRRSRPTDPGILPEYPTLDTSDEADLAMLTAILAYCMEHLTDDQRAVISATVASRFGEEPLKLSEWVGLPSQLGTKTYEAWRRQRDRGVKSLRRCVERERANMGCSDGR